MALKKKTNNLFPIEFNGKDYYEDDCNSVFLCFYTCPEALMENCGVYVFDGMIIHPDGSYADDEEEEEEYDDLDELDDQKEDELSF